MRFLAFLVLATLASAEEFSPLVDAQNTIDWITRLQLSHVYVDQKGDTYFAGVLPPGNTLPVTYTLGVAGSYDLVVFKLDAKFEQIRFITIIGGSGVEALTGMQVDGEGHVFLSGTTGGGGFPVTKRLPGVSDSSGAFVLRLNPAGNGVDYCVLMPMGNRTLTLGSDGGLYLGGNADAGQVPVTPNAYLVQPPQTFGSGYVMRLRAADGEIDFATWVGQATIQSMAARRDGGVAFAPDVLAGLNGAGSRLDFTSPLQAPNSLVKADAIGNLYVFEQAPSSRLTKYSGQGRLIQSIDVGFGFSAGAMAVGTEGTVFLTGAASASFPTRNSLERCYANRPGAQFSGGIGAVMLAVNATGAAIYSGFLSPEFIATALSSDGRHLYGAAGGLGPLRSRGVVRLDLQQLPTTARLSPACLANGASYDSGPATPGEIMTIYGSGIGPQVGRSFELVNGRVPTVLADVSVTVDGVPAPILYAQDTQINFIVPWGARPFGTMSICVTRGADKECMDSWARATDLGIFGDAQGPLVVLPDGTRSSRVVSGGYFTIYLTGTGSMDGSVVDGDVSGFPLRRMNARVRAIVRETFPICGPGGICRQIPDAEVSYAGNSPGLVWGVTQMNLKLPNLDPGSYEVTLTDSSSAGTRTLHLDVYRGQQ